MYHEPAAPLTAPQLHDALFEAPFGIGVGDGAAVETDHAAVGHAEPADGPQQG